MNYRTAALPILFLIGGIMLCIYLFGFIKTAPHRSFPLSALRRTIAACSSASSPLICFKKNIPYLIQSYCQKSSTSDFTLMHCHMQLGSIVSGITNQNIETALTFCDALVSTNSMHDAAHHCYEGAWSAYFRLISSTNNPSHRSFGWLKDVCDSFQTHIEGSKKQSACFTQGWVLFPKETETADGVTRYCTLSLDPVTQRNCFDILFQRSASNTGYQSREIEVFCHQFPHTIQAVCLADSAITMLLAYEDRMEDALDLCRNEPTQSTSNACWDILAAEATGMFASQPKLLLQYCALFPKTYQPTCSASHP